MEWFVTNLIQPAVVISILCSFVRVIRGPSLPDRVIGIDLLSTTAIGYLTVYAIATGNPVYLDVGVVVALVAFLGTIAFAYYLQRRITS